MTSQCVNAGKSNDLEEIATVTHGAKGTILSLGLKEPGELAKKSNLQPGLVRI